MRKFILPILLLLSIMACNVWSSDQTYGAQHKPIPFGISQNTAYKYQLQNKIIYTYAWIGYDSSESPQAQVEREWPHFGQVVETENVGPLLIKGGTLVRCKVRRYDFWDEIH